MAHRKHRAGKVPSHEASLGDLYYDFSRPSALASVEKLRQAASPDQRRGVKRWLESQGLYTATRKRRRTFPMNPYLPTRRNQTWEIDLMIMDTVLPWNKPFRYCMLALDCLDRYLWAEPMKQKTTKAAAEAFSAILDRAYPRQCAVLRSDSDGAFLGSDFQKLLKKRGIRLQLALNLFKAAQIERALQTVKNRIYRVFYFRGVMTWPDILQRVVDAYNHTRHSSTHLAPADVTERDIFDIYFLNYTRRRPPPPLRPPFKVGDYVKLAIDRRGLSDRGYLNTFSTEIYRIYRVQTKHATGFLAQPLYHIKDLSGEPIKPGCYAHELTLVNYDPKARKVEKVVSYRAVPRKKGQLEFEVKFGNEKKTEWVTEPQLRNLK